MEWIDRKRSGGRLNGPFLTGIGHAPEGKNIIGKEGIIMLAFIGQDKYDPGSPVKSFTGLW